jgi:predicted phosphodiesterase
MDKASSNPVKSKLTKIIEKHGLTENELDRVLESFENSVPKKRQLFKDYFGEHTRIGVFSDCHIGNEMFDEPFFRHMVNCFKREKVDKIYQVGDILEGMSGRDGHVYELSEIGFEKQMNRAVELFNLLRGINIYGIDGNHDEWYQKKGNGGVIVGKELERRLINYHHLGQMEADVEMRPGTTLKLFHANDGTAYATSYKLQKLIESFTGDAKPDIVLSGHYHKALYMFNRNVHGLECGTICGQTQFMRGKKIPAHKGFWIIDIEMGKGGIGKFAPAFYPGYK